MQKGLVLLAALFFFSCNNQDTQKPGAAAPVVLTGTSGHSAAFNQSFKAALHTYYELRDQFITENTAGIDTTASLLITAVNRILVDSVSGDSTIVLIAKTFTEGIRAELIGLKGERDMEEKRKSFQMVGEQLYDLIRTVQYDQEVIYHQYCPMAFNNEGATWLSASSEIRNPYLPAKMPHCGEVQDSIDLRIKKNN
ncbi:MAG TPA: DUF3347 domain-containing protein [Sediminibacterium sp.]|nr:DUF3347 domain-containing protein [Sediminibacterium sp.]